MENKTQIEDINREFYDFRYEETEENTFRLESGITPDIVKKISEENFHKILERKYKKN